MHTASSAGHAIVRERKCEFILSDIYLRFLITNVLRPRQKPGPKERAGAGVNRTPLLQVTTRGVVDLDSERARGALPATTAASAIAAARRELLVEVRILLGGHRHRQAQPASGTRQRRSMHMWQGRAAVRTPRGCPETKGGHAYLFMHQ